MSTRRPSVPKAQFTTGIASAPRSEGDGPATSGTTAEPGSGGLPAKGSEKVGAGSPDKGGRKDAPKRERKPASDPNARSRQEGVVHAAENSPVPARTFSGRLLALGLTLGVFTVLLAPNVHTFMTQRAEISALQADIAVRETQQGDFQAELARWDDPAYVKKQARDRVSMLMPGETGYWVYGADGVAGLENSVQEAQAAAGQSTSAKSATEVKESHWVDNLWGAVKESATVQAPAEKPAEKPADKPADPASAPAADPADPEPAP
ncbi:cell division protein FtsB [Arthrobacter stackebrandtii]|uniref:Cell division protein FtsB n=1 Tax=Arthrobacter stackebrandtii TaxID=272161 RepID=A0ABS4YUM8_9MICC|nr:septum formation initiator family protein [Arthrobacter stackebrandtii]MBP2411658.1 cell division protein FtsB [Arthrobacter stackebrandtii]PYG99693.1 septation ring formation regulator EzrA [Arthrobacter stackebrandtii]